MDADGDGWSVEDMTVGDVGALGRGGHVRLTEVLPRVERRGFG